MRSNNLLIISNSFPNKGGEFGGNIFVKEQLNYIKSYFDNIFVISPVAFGMSYTRKAHFEDYSFDNVHVFFPKYFNIPICYKYWKNIWVMLEARAIFKLIKKEKIEFAFVHSHFTWPSGAVAAKLKKKLGFSLVITEHTSVTFQKAIDNKDPTFVHAWRMADTIIRVKKSDIHLMENVGISLEKVKYLPNGYDHKKFFVSETQICRQILGLPKNKKIILNVGFLYSNVKGHFYLIESMKDIISKRNDVMCFIVGDGILREKLEKQILSSNLQNHIKIVGSKPHHEISLWMNACDLFVLPSLKESFGIVQVEAMACGKPVVSTYNGGSEEIIVSNDYGLLCEPGNSTDLASTIICALSKDWNSNKIKDYSAQFRWETISQEILSIYSHLK